MKNQNKIIKNENTKWKTKTKNEYEKQQRKTKKIKIINKQKWERTYTKHKIKNE